MSAGFSYAMQLLRGSEVLPSRDAAYVVLNEFDRHMVAQPIVLIFTYGTSLGILFAVGKKNWSDAIEGTPSFGPSYYDVITDSTFDAVQDISVVNNKLQYTALTKNGAQTTVLDIQPIIKTDDIIVFNKDGILGAKMSLKITNNTISLLGINDKVISTIDIPASIQRAFSITELDLGTYPTSKVLMDKILNSTKIIPGCSISGLITPSDLPNGLKSAYMEMTAQTKGTASASLYSSAGSTQQYCYTLYSGENSVTWKSATDAEGNLKSDGSVLMDEAYVPDSGQSLVTKTYVDTNTIKDVKINGDSVVNNRIAAFNLPNVPELIEEHNISSHSHDTLFEQRGNLLQYDSASKQLSLLSGTVILNTVILDGGGSGKVKDVLVNGISVLDASGNADIAVPLALSELKNDMSFIQATQVDTLPEIGTENTLYIVKVEENYSEYLWIDKSWLLLGSTEGSAVTTKDIKASPGVTVGGIIEGTILPVGTDIDNLLTKMLIKESYPTITSPTLKLMENQSTREVGDILPSETPIVCEFTPGTFNSISTDGTTWTDNQPATGIRPLGGSLNIYLDGNIITVNQSMTNNVYSTTVSGNITVQSKEMLLTAGVSYGKSTGIPKTSLNTPYPELSIPGGTSSDSTVLCIGKRRTWHGSSSYPIDFTTSEQVRAITTNTLGIPDNGIITVNMNTGDMCGFIIYPAFYGELTYIEDTNNAGMNVIDSWRDLLKPIPTISVSGNNNFSTINYYKYIYTGSPLLSPITFKIRFTSQ